MLKIVALKLSICLFDLETYLIKYQLNKIRQIDKSKTNVVIYLRKLLSGGVVSNLINQPYKCFTLNINYLDY